MVNHVAAQTMLMVVVTSVLFGVLDFLRVSFVRIIFVFMYAMSQSLMRGVGQMKVPLMIVPGTVLLNFIFDPLFIFG